MSADYLKLKAKSLETKYAAMPPDSAAAAITADCVRKVLKPFTVADIATALGAGAATPTLGTAQSVDTVKRIRSLPAAGAVRTSIINQDRVALAVDLQLLFAAGDITQAQADACAALLTATMPDPTGTLDLPGWDLPANASDVTKARSM